MTNFTKVAAAVMLTTFAGVSMVGSAQAAKVKRVCEHKVSKRIYTTCASSEQLRIRKPKYPTRQNFRARTNDEYTKDLNGGGNGGRGGRGGTQGGTP